MKLHKSELELESLVRRIERGEIDLQPDFQRGEVWDKPRRQRLIDTLLRNWYVPAVHLVKQDDTREVVLDGQQRLAAIRDFFADEFPVDGNIQPADEEIGSLHGLKFSKLPEKHQRALGRFSLQLITLDAFDPGEPNELFFRLNQSYNLTPPEKRNALHGEARNQVRSLVNRLVDSGLLRREVIGFSNSRLAYDDVVSRTCVAIEVGSIRRHINNSVVEDYYRNGDGFSDATIEAVEESATRLRLQISQTTDRVKFNKGTLQTWLTYGFWAPRVASEMPEGLLARFEEDRSRVRRGDTEHEGAERQRILSIVAIYDDRASYRVTDVSSVVLRDLVIHLYSQAVFGTPPFLQSDTVLADLSSDQDRQPQALLSAFQENAGWGSSLW